jgi:flavorubredoxin
VTDVAAIEVRVSEVAAGVHQLSTYLPGMDFSLNQYVVDGDEPLLFHTGMRWMFPSVSAAVARVVSVDALRWIAFGHIEADECGSMSEWLDAAPQSTVVQGMTGCMVSIGDLANRPPRPLADGELLDIGGHRLRWLDTPHVPHAWESGLLYDETTRTLFCGDLFTQMGHYAATTDEDIVGPAIAAENAFPGSSSLHPGTGATIHRLSALEIDVLAPMHAPAFTGDCRRALDQLAADYDERVAAFEPHQPARPV